MIGVLSKDVIKPQSSSVLSGGSAFWLRYSTIAMPDIVPIKVLAINGRLRRWSVLSILINALAKPPKAQNTQNGSQLNKKGADSPCNSVI